MEAAWLDNPRDVQSMPGACACSCAQGFSAFGFLSASTVAMISRLFAPGAASSNQGYRPHFHDRQFMYFYVYLYTVSKIIPHPHLRYVCLHY